MNDAESTMDEKESDRDPRFDALFLYTHRKFVIHYNGDRVRLYINLLFRKWFSNR